MSNYREMVLEIMNKEDYKPVTIDHFINAFDAHDSEDFKEVVKVMVALEEEGIIFRTKKDKYMKVAETNLVKGKLSMHKRGFGFLRVEDEDVDDIFIPPTGINGALDGDTVLVETFNETSGTNMEGNITSILTRGITRVVGEYVDNKSFGFVLPDSKTFTTDLFIPKGQNLGAIDGHKVLVEITTYPEKVHSIPEAHVTLILGLTNDPGVDLSSILFIHGINIVCPQEELDQAEYVSATIQMGALRDRTDLRHENTITIDGAVAKDL